MYGAQTLTKTNRPRLQFENDVEMYGAQTWRDCNSKYQGFENDVEMYGAQTLTIRFPTLLRLRMM